MRTRAAARFPAPARRTGRLGEMAAIGEGAARGGPRLTWIFGSSRSGSTWLLRMLAELGSVATVDDPHIGHHLGTWRPISLAWAAADEEPELTTLTKVKREKDGYFFNERYEEVWRPALRELIRARMQAQADEQHPEGQRMIFVKEPGSQAADLLTSLFPESNLIFLLRDGRDVVDSWIDAYQDGSWAIEEGAFPASSDGREALVRWQASVWAYRTALVREVYERHPRDRRVLVRYEDLLADAPHELARICAMAGLAEAADLPRLAEVAAAHRFTKLPEERCGSGQEQRAASPGRWRHNLTARERSAMERIMGPELERSGYFRSGRGAAA